MSEATGVSSGLVRRDARSTPKVSIGLPVYNGGAHLVSALDSLLSQSWTDFELIVSNNASVDDTDAICRRYAALDDRIRYFPQENNIGATANFNFVLNQSVGEFFMWAAHDDLWEPDFLREMLALMTDVGVELAFCRFDNITYTESAPTREFDLSVITADTVVEGLYKFLVHPEQDGKANSFYSLLRRSTVLRHGGLRILGRGFWGADMLYSFSLLLHGRLAVSDRLLFHKRNAPVNALPAGDVSDGSRLARLVNKFSTRRRDSIDRLGYLVGYWRILNSAGHLPWWGVWRLRCVVILKLCSRTSRLFTSYLVLFLLGLMRLQFKI